MTGNILTNNTGTIEQLGLNKQAQRFLESISHARYLLNGEIKEVPLLKTSIEENKVKIYVYFDDGVVGNLKNISLIDVDGDAVATMKRELIKEARKGFYALFSYTFKEEEVLDGI